MFTQSSSLAFEVRLLSDNMEFLVLPHRKKAFSTVIPLFYATIVLAHAPFVCAH